MRFASIDQGTTSTRALTLDSNGMFRVAHSVSHRQVYPQAGWVEHDPEELIRNIQACADAVGPVDAIGFDNQGESCLAWDATDKSALSPVIVWQDNRTSGQLLALKNQGLEQETLARSGLPLDPYFSASKLAWIIQNIPAAAAAFDQGTLRLGTTDAFFLDRLCDRFVTDVSTASRTSLMNIDTLQWDPVLCEIFGVPIDMLPEIVPTVDDFGTLKTQNSVIPVTASIVDQQAALFASGCRALGDAKITFGTGAFALMVTDDMVHRRPNQGLLPTVAWQFADKKPVYGIDGGVFTAGAAVNWAKSLGLFGGFSEINAFDAPAAIEGGLAFVPALAGMGCPYWDSGARGAWHGLSLSHQPHDLMQAVLEGVAFRAAQALGSMGHCARLPDILPIDGGMSTNSYFVQFLSDVLQCELRTAAVPELTGIGAAQLAAKGAGFDVKASFQHSSYRPKADRSREQKMFDEACCISQRWAKTTGAE